jgi:hypothetical protein
MEYFSSLPPKIYILYTVVKLEQRNPQVRTILMVQFVFDVSFVSDFEWFAIQAHEINGLQALIESNIPNLHFPLQINVDYLGRRLSASTLLPIGSDTLIYGSSDGGKSIVASNAEMNSIMRLIGEKLHLKPHHVGNPEVRGRSSVCFFP